MGRVIIILATVVLVLCAVPYARAQEVAPAPAACRVPDRERALKARSLLEDIMKLASGPLEGKKSLETIKANPNQLRENFAFLRCNEPALAPKEVAEQRAFLARASAWADRQEARIAAEENARATIVVPLCEAVWGVESAKADIAREKANPSGIVDLNALHSAGNAVQYWQSIVDGLKPQYLAFRHHPFASWRAEGACVAASESQ